MVKCTVCNNEVDENAEFCPNCGTKVDASTFAQETENQPVQTENTKFCSNCGETIDINAVVCPKCGVKVGGVTEEKSPIMALILSLLVCGLGQFYNGQPKKGIILLISAMVSGLLILLVIGFVLLPIVWIYNLYDAYTTAEKISNGIEVEDKIF